MCYIHMPRCLSAIIRGVILQIPLYQVTIILIIITGYLFPPEYIIVRPDLGNWLVFALVVFGSASLPHFPPSLILIYSRIRRLGYWRSILVWSSLRKGIIKYILFDLEPAKAY